MILKKRGKKEEYVREEDSEGKRNLREDRIGWETTTQNCFEEARLKGEI